MLEICIFFIKSRINEIIKHLVKLLIKSCSMFYMFIFIPLISVEQHLWCAASYVITLNWIKKQYYIRQKQLKCYQSSSFALNFDKLQFGLKLFSGKKQWTFTLKACIGFIWKCFHNWINPSLWTVKRVFNK